MVFAGNSARLLYAFLQVALDGGASVKSGLFRVKFLRRERSRIAPLVGYSTGFRVSLRLINIVTVVE
jgi:hypothetical protein